MVLRLKYSNIVRDLFVLLANIQYVFVRIENIQYICYVSLQGFMKRRRSVKTKIPFISYCILYFDQLLINRAQIFSLAD